MIKQVEKTKENIILIAAEYGMTEQDFRYMIKRSKLAGPFDPEKWKEYVEAISHLPPCPLCQGDQMAERSLIGLFHSPRGLRCRINRHHFFIYHLGTRLVMHDHPEMDHNNAVKWIINNWMEDKFNESGDSIPEEQQGTKTSED